MKNVFLFSAAVAGTVIISGCTTTNDTVPVFKRGKDEPVIDQTTGKSKAELKAEKTLDNMLDAIQKLDYSEFSKDFSKELKERLTGDKFGEVFGKMNKRFGKVDKKLYLGSLKKGNITIYMWKATFTKQPKDNEIFIRLIMENTSGSQEIYGFDVGLM
jgi:hypothetical protein